MKEKPEAERRRRALRTALTRVNFMFEFHERPGMHRRTPRIYLIESHANVGRTQDTRWGLWVANWVI